MKTFPLEPDCPTQPSLDFMIHPVASGPALSFSSTLLWSPSPKLWWSVYIPHILILVYTRFSIAKAKNSCVLIICIDATPQDEYPYYGLKSCAFYLQTRSTENQRSLWSIIGPYILRELPNIGQKSSQARQAHSSWRPAPAELFWDLSNPNSKQRMIPCVAVLPGKRFRHGDH